MKALVLLLAMLGAVSAHAIDDSNEINVENVVRLMNDYRAELSLPPLRHDADLAKAAEDRMRHMEDGGWWSHESPDGMSPFVWMRVRNYDYAYAGENLANGFETAQLLVASWMESKGHRENILGVQFNDCGIAIIEGSTKGPMIGRSIVVLFARRNPR